MRYFDRAGLFAEACQEYGFLSPSEEKNSILFTLAVCCNRCHFGVGQLSGGVP